VAALAAPTALTAAVTSRCSKVEVLLAMMSQL
jgi:hypothetical protein